MTVNELVWSLLIMLIFAAAVWLIWAKGGRR